ncbi:MAG: peptidoglycan DD-metalloendopeptidase family protein [Bacteroidales bacterium]|jgi:LysM repeat protein|nr:peptidoglycan DD-metalloendopeptidase family protein [Bacteroidales bacterium]
MKKRRRIAVFLYFILIVFVSQELRALSLYIVGNVSDTIIIPSSSLYGNTWGGENTRLRTNLLNIHQNYILPLQVENENVFVFPCINKTYICSFYGMRSGRMHTGMDIKQNLGDSIVAVWDGIVRMSQKNYYAYGGTVVIRHANGLETLYAHLSDIIVKENQAVKAGELIGLAGRTGRATTEHLHFETRFLYEHFNPQTIIDFNTFSLRSDTLYVSNGIFSNTPFFMQDTVKTEDTIPLEPTFITDIVVEKENHPIEVTLPEKPEIQSQQNTCIVKKGDTLYSISKKYGIGINVICQLNNIKQESILHIGQKLKLK